MPDDQRKPIYRELHDGPLSLQNAQNKQSAIRILTILREYLEPASVLDVGCGLGPWLAAAQELGIHDIQGLEGPWLDVTRLTIEPEKVQLIDLEKPFDLHRKFDLAVCLEVGEHLAPAAAPHLIASLAAHSDHILFSAAIPFQGGHHHVNEQFLPYWINLFAAHHYVPLDLFRGKIWSDPSILRWLRQNIVLFVRAEILNKNEKLAQERLFNRPLSIVHPEIYSARLQQAEAALRVHQQLFNILSQGGRFDVEKQSDGQINIRKL